MSTRRTIFDDTMGHTFPSLQEMCDFHGINKGTYQDRKRHGLSEKDALNPNYRPYKGKSKICYDHLGNKFPSIKAMCQHYNVPETRYHSRIRLGFTVEQALSDTYEKPKTKIYDHLENEYDTVEQLVQAYNITQAMYYQRRQKGWSLEKALTTKPRHSKSTQKIDTIEDRTDFRGNQYISIKEMCERWNIDTLTYQRRLERGWSKERALTEPIDTTKHGKPMTDPFGQQYPMLKDMLDAYGIKTSAYFERSKAGYSLMETLSCIPLLNHNVHDITFDNVLQLVKPVYNGTDGYQTYFLCKYDNHEIILHHNEIVNYCQKRQIVI